MSRCVNVFGKKCNFVLTAKEYNSLYKFAVHEKVCSVLLQYCIVYTVVLKQLFVSF